MYQRQAQGLASLGRGPDTELVHMTPQEVKSFDRLARVMGHDGLPTNPQTGLPEAGIFDSILPVIGGLGLTVLTGGAINPLTAGLITGLGTGIATGSSKKGLMAALGGFGGASLGAGLGAAGGGLSTTAGAGSNAATAAKGIGAVAQNPAAFGTTVGAAGPINPGVIGGGKGLALAGGAALAPAMMQPPPEFKPVEFEKEVYNYPEGGFMPPPRTSIDPFAGDPVAAGFTEERSYFTPEPYTSPGYMPAKAGGLVSLHEGGMLPTTPDSGMLPTTPDSGPISSDSGNVQAEMARNRYRTGQLQQTSDSNRWTGGTLEEYKDWYNKKNPIQTREFKNWSKMYEDAGGAEGTPATATSGSAFDSQMAQVTRDRRAGIFGGNQGLLPTTPDKQPYLNDSRIKDLLEQLLSGAARNNTESPQFLGGPQNFAGLGAIQMQSKNQGGLLRGPGDGMSDDIMLPITGSRDIAAVSPDEFVVPADVVSGLGNGSTSAGAKQLYGMMDRVRDARTGKTTQPRAIDAGKMMPA